MSRDGRVALPSDAMGLSAVCDCGISRSYSHTIFDVTTIVFVLRGYCKKFPCTCI